MPKKKKIEPLHWGDQEELDMEEDLEEYEQASKQIKKQRDSHWNEEDEVLEQEIEKQHEEPSQ